MKRAWIILRKRITADASAAFEHGSEFLNAGGRLLLDLLESTIFALVMLVEWLRIWLETDEAPRDFKPTVEQRTCEIVEEDKP